MTIRHTLRFNVYLDPNEKGNYEISLLDLIKRDKQQIPNEYNKEEMDHIDKLVKDMEAKYGPVAVVKGRRIRVNDFVDQGNGYDADDPFIDDSGEDEALAVAPDLMTEHGGFFLNKERLKLNESNFIIERVEGGNDSSSASKQKFHPSNISKKSKSQQLLSQARKRLTTSSSIKGATKRRIVTTSDEKLEEIFNDVVAVKKAPTNTEVCKVETAVKSGKKAEQSEVSILSLDKDSSQTNIANIIVPQPKVDLPLGLSDALMEKIRSLIEISEKCKLDGTKIPAHFNTVLFELDNMLNIDQKGAKNTRAQVLRFVSQQVDIKYDSILRRICKIKDSHKKQNMMPLFKSLEDAIKEAMVDGQAQYASAMQQYASKVEAAKPSPQADQNGEAAEAAKSKLKPPKRTFKWTPACKTLLFKLASSELRQYRASSGKGTPEEHLSKFYQASVIGLFQPRWMTVCQLMKVSTPLLNDFKQCLQSGKEFSTPPAVKVKSDPKVAVISTEPSAPSCASSASSSSTALVLKDAILSLAKCALPLITKAAPPPDTKGKPLAAPLASKKPILQLKQPLGSPTSLNGTSVKQAHQQLIANTVVKGIKPTVRSSSIIPANRLSVSNSPKQTQEAVKRYADGSLVSPPQSPYCTVLKDQYFPHNHQSLSFVPNYLYPHSNDPHQLDQHQQQHHINHNSSIDQYCASQKLFSHSSPYAHKGSNNIILDSISQQNLSEMSTIFSPKSADSLRQPSTPKQRRLTAESPRQYEAVLPSGYRQGPPMIDLTGGDASSALPVVDQSMFVNMNAAHCTNQRGFHN